MEIFAFLRLQKTTSIILRRRVLQSFVCLTIVLFYTNKNKGKKITRKLLFINTTYRQNACVYDEFMWAVCVYEKK